jgi:hypothetical protein
MVTITAAQMKKVDDLVMLKENARKNVGNLYLTDIGIPREIYKELGIDINNILQIKIL